jgi:hypothetical protein
MRGWLHIGSWHADARNIREQKQRLGILEIRDPAFQAISIAVGNAALSHAGICVQAIQALCLDP